VSSPCHTRRPLIAVSSRVRRGAANVSDRERARHPLPEAVGADEHLAGRLASTCALMFAYWGRLSNRGKTANKSSINTG
jgi:hypothetical protein